MPCFRISAFMICVTSGTQPPQAVPAFVQDFNAPMVVAPSATAAHSAPFDTSLHEQICAASGKASTPSPAFCWPSACGRMRNSGNSGSSILLSIICKSVPYSLASPTITPPKRYLPQSETTIFL